MIPDSDYYTAWNNLHKEYTKLGYEVRNLKMTKYCEDLIISAKEKYYKGETIMSDLYYDKLEDYLRVLCPTSEILEKVG